MSGEIYKDAEIFFKHDPEFTRLLNHLAEDEAWHFHIMGSASDFYKNAPQLPACIILDDALMTRLEAPFRENRKMISAGTLTRDAMLDCIVRTEFSEWNDIFLYVVNTLKGKRREFVYVASKLEQHKKYIERYLETLPLGSVFLDRIRRVPTVWNIRILVVEDYEPIRELVADLLSTEGIVETAENGEEGLKKATLQYYDLILSDNYMNVMSGIEFFKQIALRDPRVAERFLFLVDDIKPDHLDFIAKHNIRYLMKPFPVDDFQRMVHDMLSKTAPQGRL
jgi:CheY-like chemotaxis protein